MKLYCPIIEADVEIDNNKCNYKIGTGKHVNGTCPHKNTLYCLLTLKKVKK